jgi:hypothetical protein
MTDPSPQPLPENDRQQPPELEELVEVEEPAQRREVDQRAAPQETPPPRRRFRRRSSDRQLRESGLPDRLRAIVSEIVRRSRLWPREKADVAGELIVHFADGLESGEPPESMEAAFGSPSRAATLIRRAKRRQRPLAWKVWVRSIQVLGVWLAVVVAVYLAAAVRLFMGSPNIAHNYLADLNARAASVVPADRAWPQYRVALLDLEAPPDALKVDVRPSDPAWGDVRAYLESNAEVLEAVREAAARPGLGFVVGFSVDEADRGLWPQVEGDVIPANLAAVLLPHLAELRKLGRLLAHDAYRAAELGDGELVSANVAAILAMAAHARETPLFLNDLVSLALVKLATSTISEILSVRPEVLTDRQLHDLAHRLAALSDADLAVRLEGEQLWFHDMVQRLYTDDGEGDGHMTSEGLRAIMNLGSQETDPVGPLAPALGLVLAGRREMTNEYLRWMALAEGEFAKPLWRQDVVSFGRQRERVMASPAYTWRFFPIAKMMPALARLGVGPELTRQQRDAVCVVIALELYRRNTGAWPAGLEALVPTLLPSVPPDRFDGQPLRYRLVEGRPVVYSVGADRNDDGGRPPRNKAGIPDPDRAMLVSHHLDFEPADGDWILWPRVVPDVPAPEPAQRVEQADDLTADS